MKKVAYLLVNLFSLIAINAYCQFDNPKLPLKVSADGRYFQFQNGKSFFWMGDTGWELFHRLDKKEADFYLETRAKQGYNVIQAVVLPELKGLTEPNRNGDLPFINKNIHQPNEKYFAFVDAVIDKAASLGMFVALLPSWGDAWNYKPWGDKQNIFDSANCYTYGKFIGNRYKHSWNVIWVLGGDRNPENETHYKIIRALVKGIKETDGGKHLFTYHPGGSCSSASFFHEDKWLDFNMVQSGHGDRNGATYLYTLNNYVLSPAKPCLDGEPRYEDIPVKFWEIKLDEKYKNNPYEIADSLTPYGYFNELDIRKAAYWSVFSGACGHTYGNGSIWGFWQPGRFSPIAVKYSWQTAMSSPGGIQMGHLRKLIEQFGVNNLRPDRNVITNNSFSGENYIAALRTKNGSGVLLYSPDGKKFTVSLTKLSTKKIIVRWFNPRDGLYTGITDVDTEKLISEFTPPSEGIDWVLIITKK